MARHLIDSDDRPSGEQRPLAVDGGPVEPDERPAGLLERVKRAWGVLLFLAGLLAAGGAAWAWNAGKATKADVAAEHALVEGTARDVDDLKRRVIGDKNGKGGLEEKMEWMTGAVWAIAIKTGADVPPPPK